MMLLFLLWRAFTRFYLVFDAPIDLPILSLILPGFYLVLQRNNDGEIPRVAENEEPKPTTELDPKHRDWWYRARSPRIFCSLFFVFFRSVSVRAWILISGSFVLVSPRPSRRMTPLSPRRRRRGVVRVTEFCRNSVTRLASGCAADVPPLCGVLTKCQRQRRGSNPFRQPNDHFEFLFSLPRFFLSFDFPG